MIRYAFTIFLSAFLLFQIQPMIAKFILPWYGGSAAVWTTSMMFFQIVLLLGYLYAHSLRVFLKPRTALWLHALLLLAAAALLQREPPEFLRPTGGENLTVAIVQLLTLTVGLPFFALSSTGPLVQAWHSRSHGSSTSGKTYRLYALSNLGSMLALLTYPFLVEPYLPLRTQTFAWSIGFVLFALFSFWSGWQTRTCDQWVERSDSSTKEGPAVPGPSSAQIDPPTRFDWVMWVGLAMTPSILLLAVTNMMCQEVASIPFLWILPLAIYLISLIICFDRPVLYWRRFYWLLTVLTVIGAILLVHVTNQASLLLQVCGFSFGFFVWCMTAHGELERLKPNPRFLTFYYLLISTGGALGGVFVVVIAPRIFVEYCELHVGLLLCLGLPLLVRVKESYQSASKGKSTTPIYLNVFSALIAASCVACSLIYYLAPIKESKILGRIRNEYGLVYVYNKTKDYRIMVNGRTEHGGQFLDSDRELQPNGYYIDGCGPAVAVQAYRGWLKENGKKEPLKFGVLGLGTGSLVTWGKLEDEFTFYEINPASETLARKFFTYLERWGQNAEVILGDGRVQLKRKLEEDGPQDYDLIFLDAFTSDSIPAHLMTRESFELYLQHLKPDGVLVAHITNRFVDLRGVTKGLADEFNLTSRYIEVLDDVNATDWVVMSRNKSVLTQPIVKSNTQNWPKDLETTVWTDDFYSLASVVDWSFKFRWANREQPPEDKEVADEDQE